MATLATPFLFGSSSFNGKHSTLDELEFRLDLSSDFGVSCP